MLPSTGLFKTINCPFYGADHCVRPFCHYKHVRKDPPTSPIKTATKAATSTTNNGDEPLANEAATSVAPPPPPTTITVPVQWPAIQLLEAPVYVYKPTPKAQLSKEQPSTTPPPPSSDEPTSKRQRLEYVPTSKTTGQDHYGKSRAVAVPHVAEYDPTSTLKRAASSGVAELKRSHSASEPDGAENTSGRSSRDSRGSPDRDEKDLDKDEERRSRKDRDATDKTGEHKQLREHNSSTSHRSESGSRHRSGGSSSKSARSSSSSHRQSTENAHKSSSSSSSSSKRSDGKSSSSRSSSKNGGSSSSSHTKSKESSRHRSSEKSSSTSKSSSSRKSTKETDTVPVDSAPLMLPPSNAFDSDSDEDDVMAQCRLIFDEFQSAPDEAVDGDATANGSATKKPTGKSADELSLEFDEALRKKRVAYEGADNGRPTVAGAPPAMGKNHARVAIESVFKRHEIVRIQLEKMEAKKAADQAANDKRLADLEAERVAKAKESLKRTAHVPAAGADRTSVPRTSANHRVAHSSAAMPQKATPATGQMATSSSSSMRAAIAPASGAAAMLRAKQKIEAMRAAKQPTVSRSACKGTGRVAHMTSAAVKTGPDGESERTAPPVLEPQSTKISLNLRMQYYTMMVQHCRTIYDHCEDAWERAQAVELGVFNKCNTPMIYKKSATLAINTLRKESNEADKNGPSTFKTVSHEAILGGRKALNTSWSVKQHSKTPTSNAAVASRCNSNNPLDQVSGPKAFDMVYDVRLTEAQLHDNGFPRPAANDRPGWAQIQLTHCKARPNNEHDRYCARCGTVFNLSHFDDDTIVDACNYHAKSPGFLRGSTINAHRCCQQPSGSPGCMYANHHVTDHLDVGRLTGFVRTIARGDDYRTTRADLFALDCEMCYTTHGLELTRVTVVNWERKTVYDALVRPDNKVIDYNTMYSGITAEMLATEKRTLRDVQAVLLSMFHARTVLIGHSLDSDLKALKMIHDVVVDTSVLFPHKLGPPKKRALKMLCVDHLKRIIQEGEAGHDSAEDAEVCIQLVRHYLQNQIV